MHLKFNIQSLYLSKSYKQNLCFNSASQKEVRKAILGGGVAFRKDIKYFFVIPHPAMVLHASSTYLRFCFRFFLSYKATSYLC